MRLALFEGLSKPRLLSQLRLFHFDDTGIATCKDLLSSTLCKAEGRSSLGERGSRQAGSERTERGESSQGGKLFVTWALRSLVVPRTTCGIVVEFPRTQR